MRYWLITYTWLGNFKTEAIATSPVDWLIQKRKDAPGVALLLVSSLTEMEYSELNQ